MARFPFAAFTFFRVLSTILLLCAVSGPVRGQTHVSGSGLGRYENAVRQIAYRFLDDPPVPGCSLYVGSSSIRRWKDLDKVFPDDYPVNAGFGGSHISYNIDAIERIHLPCRPSRITFYCGGNDLNSGKSLDFVFSDFKYYLGRLWNEEPLVEVYVMAVNHAPAGEKNWSRFDEYYARLDDLASRADGLHSVDFVRLLLNQDGTAREELYVKDRVHMNEQGYAIWAEAFKDVYKDSRELPKRDIRKLFQERKRLGLFGDPRFVRDGIEIKEPPEFDRKLNVVFIGDELTGTAGDLSPVVFCAGYLKKQAGIGEVTVRNLGTGGLRSADYLPTAKKEYPKIGKLVQEFESGKNAQLVFSVMLGGNDVLGNSRNEESVTPDRYRENLRALVDKLLADHPEAVIVLHSPIRQVDSEQSTEDQLRLWNCAAELKTLTEYYASTSDGHRVFQGDVKAFHYFKKRHAETTDRATENSFPRLNKRGADVLGRFWGAAIRDIL